MKINKSVKKSILIAGGGVAISLAALLGAGLATAETKANSLVDAISQKFNLKKEDVQKVFDDNKITRQAEHQANVKARLDKAVTDGKITADQEQKIIAKLAEGKTFFDTLKDKTGSERKIAINAHQAELEAWAKTNNINMQFLAGGGRGWGKHHGSKRMRGLDTD